jgi:hypothetical protein
MAEPTYEAALIQKHRRSGLLLYQVGLFDERAIKNFPQTKQYTIDDYHLLAKLIGRFSSVATTPNILTEVSNLSGKLSDPNLPRFRAAFKSKIDVIEEEYCTSRQAADSLAFAKFGLTDAGIASLVSENDFLVLTDDLPLAHWLQSKGADVLNFNRIRQLSWSEQG